MNINITVTGAFAVIVVMLLCGTYLIAKFDFDPNMDLMAQPRILFGGLLITIGMISFLLIPYRYYRSG